MTAQDLIDTVLRQQVLLERYGVKTAQDMKGFIDKVDTLLAQGLSALKVEKMNELTRGQLKDVIRNLQFVQQEVYTKANAQHMTALEDLAKYTAKFEQQTFGRFSKDLPLVAVDAEKAWAGIKGSPIRATGQLLEPFVTSWSDKTLAGVDQWVTKAWQQGLTVQDTIRGLRGTKKLNFQDGLTSMSRRQAEAVARTSVAHVAQEARNKVWDANEDILQGWQFVATLDSRTTTQCKSLDGQVFPLGEGPQPPVHVNCRSTTVPVLRDEFAFLEEGATRSSKDGYVDAGRTYYDWLKDQPEAFQNEALGPARAKLFRDGGLSPAAFARLNLGRNFQPLTLAQMQEMNPLAFERARVTLTERQKAAEAARIKAAEEAERKRAEEARKAQEAERVAAAKKAAEEAAKKAAEAKKAAAFNPDPEENNFGLLKRLKMQEAIRKLPSSDAEARRQEALRVLALPSDQTRAKNRNFWQDSVQDVNAKLRAKAQEMVDFITKMAHKDYIKSAFFSHDKPTHYGADRAYYNPGKRTLYMPEKDTVDIWVHEVGHHLETTNPELKVWGEAFRDKRAAKTAAAKGVKNEVVKLKDVFPGWGYEDWELAWRHDGFSNKGLSKYIGKTSNCEVISMGVQMMYKDPVAFAQADHEYFDFILNILQAPRS